MDKDQAIKILTQAIDAAFKQGVFSLADANAIIQAFNKVSELVELIPTEE